MWFSRLIIAEDKLAAIIGDPMVSCHALVRDGADIGLLELDFREAGACELSFFGVVPAAVGTGAGRYLMNEALSRAWAQPICGCGCTPAPSITPMHWPSTSVPASGPTR